MAVKMVKGKERERTKLRGWTVLLLTIAVLLAAGCGAPTSVPQTPTREAREPFSARTESEDGAIVAWSGYTEGYEPGAEVAFDITIRNETDQSWHGRYCLQLLDRQLPKVITTLEQREFTLESGACAPIWQGAWELVVPLEARQALQPGVQYMVRVYQPGGPNIVATFPFDLDGPPTPSS
jgi:hypothetical protein